jgi:hypothetical protein
MSVDLPCHQCGYDLRVHPEEGKCPECGASVADARRWARIPWRPAWRDSDPRWRRRVLAGVWVLVLVPLIDALMASGWAASVPVPSIAAFRGGVRTLDEALVCYPGVYAPLAFCIGVVLLFSKECGRRRGPLDWTRRWGVICSYVVMLLAAAQILFLCAYVLTGIAATFLYMPLRYQPPVTPLFAAVSSGYLRFGPYPREMSVVVLVAFSSITILLASIALFDALRSCGSKRLAVILLAPLVVFALMHVAQAGRYALGISSGPPSEFFRYSVYFWPELLRHIAGVWVGVTVTGSMPSAMAVEGTKWCVVVGIAVWLSIAQFAAWRQRKKSSGRSAASGQGLPEIA